MEIDKASSGHPFSILHYCKEVITHNILIIDMTIKSQVRYALSRFSQGKGQSKSNIQFLYLLTAE
jgi:hypothetical protein